MLDGNLGMISCNEGRHEMGVRSISIQKQETRNTVIILRSGDIFIITIPNLTILSSCLVLS